MAYTQQNLNGIEQAIVDLAKGKRVVRVNIKGKSIEYSQANIAELKNLRAEIKAELQAAAGHPRFASSPRSLRRALTREVFPLSIPREASMGSSGIGFTRITFPFPSDMATLVPFLIWYFFLSAAGIITCPFAVVFAITMAYLLPNCYNMLTLGIPHVNRLGTDWAEKQWETPSGFKSLSVP